MARSKKPKQQTLDASLRKDNPKPQTKQPKDAAGDDDNMPVSLGDDVKVRRRQPPSLPPSSFMSKSNRAHHRVVDSDSETPVEEDGELDDTDGEGPSRPEIVRRRLSRPAKRNNVPVITLDDSDDEETNIRSSQSLPNQTAVSDDSDAPLVTPRSSARQKSQVVISEDEEGDEDEEDEEDIQSPAKRRKLTRNTRHVTPKSKKSASPQSSTRRMRSSARKGHRSEKEKKMELLRRRRAGEKDLTMSDLDTSDEEVEGDQGALYDTDSDHQALDVFDDESDAGPEEPATSSKKSKEAKKKQKSKASGRGDADDDDGTADSEGNLEDFIDEDDDTIGVPDEALYQIPLEFTRASRKPLKAHFKDAIEWLVHRRINPGFERDDEVYRTAWTRLNDEVIGLANSKWVSSSWRPDFYRLLRARPYIEQAELGYGHLGTDVEKCQACGRSNHPATWAINFTGKPYDSYTLDELENDTTTDSEDNSNETEQVDRDAHGNALPPEERQFFVGTVCNSNAEMAHNLLHWKPALRDWVSNMLEKEGWLAPEKLAELDRMKSKKRRKVADAVVEDWDERGIIKRLYGDFKENIRRAEERDTTKSSRGGRNYTR
ncbi:putative transcription factor iiic-like protein [Diaporthe ampelina]|uniref:Putative transcription factor iiic-like protein n=1 Tax=Diaporthe ampelina TaxID=1214573 RepID=A0A0G2FH42_9PEZI|nr:putative transcription factor iiic-like protein [Diaporthe ampelina]